MNWKKGLLKKSRLYVIIDKKILAAKSLSSTARELEKSAADIIQYRDKISPKSAFLENALLLKRIFSGTKKLFIINDYLDAARVIDSDGLHIGQDDVSVKTARRILGKDKIIGTSCHSLRQAINAVYDGADYISVGPVFPTPTKPEYKPVGLALLKKIRSIIRIPVFFIGAVNKENLEQFLDNGAQRLAICRAIINAGDIPKATRYFKKRLCQIR